MSHDDITTAILSAATRPSGELFDTGAVFQNQIGTAAALIQCRGLLRYLDASCATNVDSLQEDFRNSVIDDYTVDWGLLEHSNKNLRVWAAGYFINKAEGNIAANLDVIVNAWIVARFGMKPDDPLAGDLQELGIFHGYIGDRIRFLSTKVHTHASPNCLVARGMLKNLLDAFGKIKYTHTERVKQTIADVVSKYQGHSYDRIYFRLKDNARYVAIATARVNAFKHRFGHCLKRSGSIHHVEWAMMVHAHQWMNQFWNAMLVDVRNKNAQ
ncbi:MAG: hypothetical protein HY286_09255 [Planctomycetes bacterium]|nr:hypothetical protein [Planctomycetota bacterium]